MYKNNNKLGTEEIELEGIDYLRKFTERLYITVACINDGRDITEEDYSVLQEVHRIEKEGRLPFYKTICTESVTTTTQIDLFTDNTTDSATCYSYGTQFDVTPVNNKTEKNEHKKIQK